MCEWDDTAHKADERDDGREGEQQLVVVVALEEAKVGLRSHTHTHTTLHAQSLK